MENWNQAINHVLQTGYNYVHDQLTIERRDGNRPIAILTGGSTKRMTSQEAEEYLKKNFAFDAEPSED